jgi:MGT family glycosyltransferase
MSKTLSFLFVTWEGGGNVPPVLGLAARLIRRGHRVRVLTEPCLEKAVLAIGADYEAFQAYFTRTDSRVDLIQDWNAKPLTIPSVDNILIRPAYTVAQEVLRSLKHSPTDIVVADFMMPGALLAAEVSEIKRVTLFHMPEYLPGPGRPPGGMGLLPSNTALGRLRDSVLTAIFHRVLNQYLPALNDTRRRLGLPELRSLTELYHQSDLRLIQTSKAFDAPLTPAPANLHYVGPVLDDPAWLGEPDALWPESDQRPLVVVSLSTTFQNQKALLMNIIEAVSTLDIRCLVTLGPAMSEEDFDLPDNVIAKMGVPHSQVFPLARAVITHAGHGTVMRALSHGLPLVCLPMGRDQLDNATLVAHRGAGLKLSRNAAPKIIRRALVRVLNEAHFQEGAKALQTHILADAQNPLAETLLEALITG